MSSLCIFEKIDCSDKVKQRSMILIVDDKPENILSLKRVLELNSFNVDTALSGEEALKKILRNNYYLIILDVQMPGMDGFEVAEAITGLNKTKNIPILFLSAVNTHKKFVTKGFESGGVDYLTKPFDPDILILKVRTFYRLYEQSKKLNAAYGQLKQEIETRKQAEKVLQENVEELHSILESIPQIAFTARPDGTMEFVNQQWYRYSTNKNVFPPTPPTDRDIYDVWHEQIGDKKSVSFEVRIKEIDSAEYTFFLLRIKPVFVQNELVKWVGTFTNIHEQKKVNEFLEKNVNERTRQLIESNRQLEASNHDLLQFASVASHDLKEPLRKIHFFTSILDERYTVEKEVAEYLDKIKYSSRRMNLLIEDLLNFSKLSQDVSFEKTDLNAIIQEVLVDLELSIAEKKAKVEVMNKLPEIDAVPGMIRQALLNILSNALKFSNQLISPVIIIESQRVASLSILAESDDEGDFCLVKITDNGIGFDEKYLDKIFTLFQRLHAKDEYEGTGIGLTIVKKIIDKHHGIIEASSSPGKGSTFSIVLPIKQQIINA